MAIAGLGRVKAFTAGTCLLFLAFAAARAARVPLTYDEAASYIRYIDSASPSPFATNVWSPFSFDVATNHFLNTLLTKVCWVVAGGGELVLRLPNLVAYALYMWCAVAILRPRTTPLIGFAGLALLNLNPYVLEFFALSRGYGLSLALLLAAVLLLFRFIEAPPGSEQSERDARTTLACATAAVMANFTLLDVYVPVFAVIFTVSLWRSGGPARPGLRRGIPLLLPLVAIAFTTLVLAQDIGLSGTLYRPIVVSLVGVNQARFESAAVVATDVHGRDHRLSREAGGQWRSNPGAYVRALRIEMPAREADALGAIQVSIGSRVFPGDTRGWASHDEGAVRVFDAGASLALPRSGWRLFRPAINWSGDAHYAGQLAAAVATALLLLAALAAGLTIAGWALVRITPLRAQRWRTLQRSGLWTAALAGPPLYLLHKHSELYYGGVTGLVTDTYYSLIDRSFHGRLYVAWQTPLVFAIVVATFAVFSIALWREWRRGTADTMIPGACLGGIMLMASVLELIQHAVFGTPYLSDRTALFYIPLFVLFVVLTIGAIARVGPAARAIAGATLAAAAIMATLHFAATANTTYVFDWDTDASTKAMMRDVRAALDRDPPAHRVLLGVEPTYAPVAVYYLRRTAADVDVVAPAAPGAALFYGREGGVPSGMQVIARYAATATVLARAPRW